MRVLRINSEELERLSIDKLLNKLVYNHCKPGTGKTRKIHQIIDYCIEHELKIVVCMANHSLINEFLSYTRYDCVHLWGKVNFCHKEGLEAYIPGCKECNIVQTCLYKKKFERASNKPVILIVPQHLFIVDKYKPDVLVVDETIENIVFDCIEIPDMAINHIEFTEIECEECFRDNCPRRGKGWKFGFCYAKLVKKPELKGFIPETLDGHFFKETLQQDLLLF